MPGSLAQVYHPLPQSNSFWSVNEMDEETLVYDDLIYSTIGDTLINGLSYSRVFRLNDIEGIYDTSYTLHCFMRQDLPGKKIYFIRYFLGESDEKLGYDFSGAIGDTFNFPAFDYGNSGDSLFLRENGYADSIQLLTGEYRKMYFFSSLLEENWHKIIFIEGIGEYYSTFPNRRGEYDAFHETKGLCVEIDHQMKWSWYSPADSSRCGFNFLGTGELLSYQGLRVYPNPAKEIVYLTLESSINNAELVLSDFLGRKKVNILTEPGVLVYSVDVSSLSPGLYFLHLMAGSARSIQKVIILP